LIGVRNESPGGKKHPFGYDGARGSLDSDSSSKLSANGTGFQTGKGGVGGEPTGPRSGTREFKKRNASYREESEKGKTIQITEEGFF